MIASTIPAVVFQIAAQMLELAADEFSNHGCNDFELPNTPETWPLGGQ
jgi:hypothetical protein